MKIRKKNGFHREGLTNEFMDSLTETEKVLTTQYIKIQTIGKATQQVPVLIPKRVFKYYELIYDIRTNSPEWFPPHPHKPTRKNNYFFAFPNSNRWICGIAGIKKRAKKCEAKQPNSLTVVRLRKHIATVTQILSLKENDVEQLAKFMGHTKKTHEQFYK